MTRDEEDFEVALADIFGERHAELSRELRESLRSFWRTAVDGERRAVFRFLRAHLDRSEDKEGLCQLSWVVGNGTYRETPSFSPPPPWLREEEGEAAAHVADRLHVQSLGSAKWQVALGEGGEHVATVTFDEGRFEVWHTPLDPQAMAEVRYFVSWSDAFADVAARQAVLARARKARGKSTEDPADGV